MGDLVVVCRLHGSGLVGKCILLLVCRRGESGLVSRQIWLRCAGCWGVSWLVGRSCVIWSRHGIFPPIGGFLPIERPHGSFLRSVQIR